jgi:hypothetical protein
METIVIGGGGGDAPKLNTDALFALSFVFISKFWRKLNLRMSVYLTKLYYSTAMETINKFFYLMMKMKVSVPVAFFLRGNVCVQLQKGTESY